VDQANNWHITPRCLWAQADYEGVAGARFHSGLRGRGGNLFSTRVRCRMVSGMREQRPG
jgi:hypothetical protein